MLQFGGQLINLPAPQNWGDSISALTQGFVQGLQNNQQLQYMNQTTEQMKAVNALRKQELEGLKLEQGYKETFFKALQPLGQTGTGGGTSSTPSTGLLAPSASQQPAMQPQQQTQASMQRPGWGSYLAPQSTPQMSLQGTMVQPQQPVQQPGYVQAQPKTTTAPAMGQGITPNQYAQADRIVRASYFAGSPVDPATALQMVVGQQAYKSQMMPQPELFGAMAATVNGTATDQQKALVASATPEQQDMAMRYMGYTATAMGIPWDQAKARATLAHIMSQITTTQNKEKREQAAFPLEQQQKQLNIEKTKLTNQKTLLDIASGETDALMKNITAVGNMNKDEAVTVRGFLDKMSDVQGKKTELGKYLTDKKTSLDKATLDKASFVVSTLDKAWNIQNKNVSTELSLIGGMVYQAAQLNESAIYMDDRDPRKKEIVDKINGLLKAASDRWDSKQGTIFKNMASLDTASKDTVSKITSMLTKDANGNYTGISLQSAFAVDMSGRMAQYDKLYDMYNGALKTYTENQKVIKKALKAVTGISTGQSYNVPANSKVVDTGGIEPTFKSDVQKLNPDSSQAVNWMSVYAPDKYSRVLRVWPTADEATRKAILGEILNEYRSRGNQ